MVANKGKDGNLDERSDSPRHKKWEIGSSRPIFWRCELIRERETESHLDQKGIVRDQKMQCQRDGWKRREPLSRPQLPAGGDLNHTSPRPHQRAVDLECRWSRHPWVCFFFFFLQVPQVILIYGEGWEHPLQSKVRLEGFCPNLTLKSVLRKGWFI